MPKNSSEIREAAQILQELLSQAAIIAPSGKARRSANPWSDPRPKRVPVVAPAAPSPDRVLNEKPRDAGNTRDLSIGRLLYAMCERGGFNGAVVANNAGRVIALHNSPVPRDAVSAFTMALGCALEKAKNLLQQQSVNNITIDINYIEKAVLRRFMISDTAYFLMAICPQDVHEKGELALCIDQLTMILEKEKRLESQRNL